MSTRRAAASRATLALAAIGCLAGGCSGRAGVDITALNYRAIDPPAGPPPRFVRIEADHCYWWTDESGQVWIALEREVPSLLGPAGRFRFHMSLALEKPPAGRARDYLVGRRELRAVARVGPSESRFISTAGIVALYRDSGERLRGSFRLLALRETSRLLGGWSRPTQYLIMGTFVAVHDERRGRPLAAETESSGWQREPLRPPSTAPAPDAVGPIN